MKTKLYTSTLSVVALAIFLAACSAASSDKKAQLEKLKGEQTKINQEIKKLEGEIAKENPVKVTAKMKEVAVMSVTPRPFDFFVKTQGSVESVDNIIISARTMGMISQVYVVEGSEVSKGQILAQIDNSLILRNIEEVKSSLELANTVYERQKKLWDQKIGTEVAYLQAKTNKESMEKRLATLNEQVDMSRIKAPVTGSVDEVFLKIGQNAAPGAPAFRVVSSDKLKMKASVSEAYVTSIKMGDRVKLTFPDLNKTLDARVTFVGKTINQLSRTFPVEVKLPSDKDLRANMSGVLRVIYHSEPAAIVVPVNIVQDVNGQKIIYVAEMDGTQLVARKRVVEVAGVFDAEAQIKSGLKAGDQVITVGYQSLNDGQFIKI